MNVFIKILNTLSTNLLVLALAYALWCFGAWLKRRRS